MKRFIKADELSIVYQCRMLFYLQEVHLAGSIFEPLHKGFWVDNQ